MTPIVRQAGSNAFFNDRIVKKGVASRLAHSSVIITETRPCSLIGSLSRKSNPLPLTKLEIRVK